MTVWEALRATRLPLAEAELLLGRVTGWTAAERIVRRGDALAVAQRRALGRLARARARGTPIQHLTGAQEFFGVPLAAGPEALIPRADTETLVEAALERLDGPGLAADVGCGGGAVAIALAERSEACVLAVETAPRALRLARENVRNRRVLLVAGDLLTAVRPATLDLVAANLPYVPSARIAGLPAEIRDREPRNALDGGPDGLRPLARLAPLALGALKPGRPLLAEIGAGQAAAAAEILGEAGFQDVVSRPDIAGIPRVVAGVS